MRKIDYLLDTYGSSHVNETNKIIHWFCVPMILFSIIGMLMLVPLPFSDSNRYVNLGTFVMLFTTIYYLRLSVNLTLGFVIIFGTIVEMNLRLKDFCWTNNYNVTYILVSVFIAAWVGQFYGHEIEGKKPSFLKDIQYLLVGPMWLLHFVYNKFNISY